MIQSRSALLLALMVLQSCDTNTDKTIQLSKDARQITYDGRVEPAYDCSNKSFTCVYTSRIALASPRNCSSIENSEIWNTINFQFQRKVPFLHGGVADGIYLAVRRHESAFLFQSGRVTDVYLASALKLRIENYSSWKQLEDVKYRFVDYSLSLRCR